jgi:excisionase family DNA binding protein
MVKKTPILKTNQRFCLADPKKYSIITMRGTTVACFRALTQTDTLYLWVIGVTDEMSLTILSWKGEEKVKDQFNDKRLLTVQELAHYVGMSHWTVRAKVRKNEFPFKPRRLGKFLRFDIQEVDRYINSLPRA